MGLSKEIVAIFPYKNNGFTTTHMIESTFHHKPWGPLGVTRALQTNWNGSCQRISSFFYPQFEKPEKALRPLKKFLLNLQGT
jgi:hypothetical protein